MELSFNKKVDSYGFGEPEAGVPRPLKLVA